MVDTNVAGSMRWYLCNIVNVYFRPKFWLFHIHFALLLLPIYTCYGFTSPDFTTVHGTHWPTNKWLRCKMHGTAMKWKNMMHQCYWKSCAWCDRSNTERECNTTSAFNSINWTLLIVCVCVWVSIHLNMFTFCHLSF